MKRKIQARPAWNFVILPLIIICSLFVAIIIGVLMVLSAHIFPSSQMKDFLGFEKFLLFLLLYPIGLIIVVVFTDLSKWLKLVISTPVVLIAFLLAAFFTFAFFSWRHGNEESKKLNKIIDVCTKQCVNAEYPEPHATCFNKCTSGYGVDYKETFTSPVPTVFQKTSY